ncbi:hypothetical protein M758_10G146100 [Ceratodon purpureus]|nr:hypothetical protein M758_10G146100 [Ceratodon purpureus]
MDAGEAQRTDGSADVMAQGLASVLGPVVRDFDARVEGALKSQSLLTGSIDRLTKELDKLLEDTPIPMVAQHAAKLSGVRKRVASLMSTLRVIQGRIANMDRMLNARGGLLVLYGTLIFLVRFYRMLVDMDIWFMILSCSWCRCKHASFATASFGLGFAFAVTTTREFGCGVK